MPRRSGRPGWLQRLRLHCSAACGRSTGGSRTHQLGLRAHYLADRGGGGCSRATGGWLGKRARASRQQRVRPCLCRLLLILLPWPCEPLLDGLTAVAVLFTISLRSESGDKMGGMRHTGLLLPHS